MRLLDSRNVESFLRKYFWSVDLAAAGLCAIFLARATASVFEAKLVSDTPPHKPPAATYHASAGKDKSIDVILKRNLFCSSCPPIEVGDSVPPAGDGTVEASSPGALIGEPQRTAMPITLTAVMYAPPPAGIRYSLAVIRDNETKGSGAYGVGDLVRDAKVIGIEETRVHFDNRGKPEYLDLLDTPEPPRKAVDPEMAETRAAPTDELGEELDRGLKQLGEHNYELQRATLESVLGNMSLLSRSARIVPEIRDGKPAGFRLYSVRPDGPFAKIGMQNGDVIYAINGLEMSSPEKALEVYSKLKSARHLSVSLERNGERVTKEYTIR